MLSLCYRCLRYCQRQPAFYSIKKRFKHHSSVLQVSDEVEAALVAMKPVVALETTIITHGMPYPQNLSTALEVENIIRNTGAIPATIGILQGKVHVGLSKTQLEYLADPDTKAIKTSRRDLQYVLSQSLNGGTTVSGTMVISHMANIKIFVTGGIGGVHRGAESSMDISADLTELGRTPVTVVSAGVKSILDIGRTLEYLETQGVCVATYGKTREFPAFFSRTSGYQSPYNVQSPLHAAQLIAANHKLGLQTGCLVAVPIPDQFDTLGEEIETVIQSVVKEAQVVYQSKESVNRGLSAKLLDAGIAGKEVTPYILKRVNEETKGKSLEANIHLIRNNAEVGAKIAVELSKLNGGKSGSDGKGHNSVKNYQSAGLDESCSLEKNERKSNKRVTVVGGSIVDFTARMANSDFKLNGATYTGSVQQSFGGVGRNLADGLSRLDVDTLFISAVGNDSHRSAFEANCQHMNLRGVTSLEDHRTATYCAMLRNSGELMFGIGDMDIHSQITPDYIFKFEQDMCNSDLVCIDGNISVEAMEYVCDMCRNSDVPVLFDPADLHKASKPFQSSAHKGVVYSSPNYNELKMMVSHITGESLSVTGSADDLDLESVIEECCHLLQTVSNYIPITMVTLGHHGLLMCRHGNKHGPFPVRGDSVQRNGELTVVHFPASPTGCDPPHIVSVSGAGDCMVAAFISKLIQGEEPYTCIRAGLLAAQISLPSSQAVPFSLMADNISGEAIQQKMCVEPREIIL